MTKLDKLVEHAIAHLSEGEQILANVQGAYETKVLGQETVRTGIFVATNLRLIFYAKRIGGYDLESFPYDHVSSFEMSKGAMGHKMSFFASGNRVTMKWIRHGDIASFTNAVRTRMGKVSTAQVSPALVAKPISETDAADQLRKLAALRDDGILTEDEFQAKKAGLLERL